MQNNKNETMDKVIGKIVLLLKGKTAQESIDILCKAIEAIKKKAIV